MPPEEYVRKMFAYHLPATQLRIERHQEVNCATQALAELILDVIESPELQMKVIEIIQQARMLANQFITYEDITHRES